MAVFGAVPVSAVIASGHLEAGYHLGDVEECEKELKRAEAALVRAKGRVLRAKMRITQAREQRDKAQQLFGLQEFGHA